MATNPVITGAIYDGQTLTVDWVPSDDSGVTYYVIELTYVGQTGMPYPSLVIGGRESTVGALALATPLDTGRTYQVTVVAAGRNERLASPPVTLSTIRPAVTSFATDAITGVSILKWSSVAGATDYLLSFSDGASAPASTNSYRFDPALPVNTPISATIRARITAGPVVSTGPASQPFPLATAQPTLRSADFDGIAASAAWNPVPQANGYRVSIRKDGELQTEVAHFDAPAGATSASNGFTPPDPNGVYLASVQAQFRAPTALGTGPSSPTLPLFKPSYFPSAALASTTFPYVYPATKLATVLAATPSETITLYLPQLGPPLTNLPIIKGAFKLEANPDRGTAATYPYILTLAASGDAWKFTTAPIRVGLRGDYIDFLKKVEKPGDEKSGGASPSGILLLQQVISRVMPQTFQETLYYGYGLSFPSSETKDTIGYADLRPGMVLRVATDPYQTITEGSTPRWSNGYLGGPVTDYEVGTFIDSTGATTTGYDSFIGQLVAGGALTVLPPPNQAPQASGVADAADLYFAGFRTRFYRLFVPTTLAKASEPSPTATPSNFVIAAAATYEILTSARNVLGGAAPIAYFRGRAVLRPCLRVTFEGNELVVPVGTTVGNLLERAGRLPAFAAMPVQGLTVRRALGPAVLDPTAPLATNATFPIRFDWKTLAAYGPGWTAFALPLLPGDTVSTRSS